MNWEHGYIVGKAGKPHTKCPFKKWHPVEAPRYFMWLEEWKRGRKDRIEEHARQRRMHGRVANA